MAGEITETTVDVDGVEVFVRRTEGEGVPVVFVHGNPTDSRDWIPFMERLARPAIAYDLPGFGRSAKPSRREFDYSMHGQARLFGRLLDELGIDGHALLVYDWGAGVALPEAIRRAEQIERLVVMDAVPVLPGYRWHRLGRIWRTPVAGGALELLVKLRPVQAALRRGSPEGRRFPDAFAERLFESWAGASSAAVNTLYRSGDPDALAAAGSGLDRLDCPALVVWGKHDPYIPWRFGRIYAERLPNAELIELSDAGHWPWIDRPDLIDTVVRFLDGR